MPDGGMGSLLTKKAGPLPIGAWAAIAGVSGFIFVRFMAKNKAGAASASGTSDTGQGDTFSSGQTTTTTDPTTGDSVTSTYNAQGNGYLPGMLSWGAGPMPIQQGDVYVNLPAGNNTTTNTTPTTPGQLKNVASHIFPGSTNITWTLGDGDTTEVLITAKGPSWSVNETVDTKGQKAGDNGGHMFYIDAPSRGATITYTLTPMNNGVAGPPSQITATNAK